MDTTDGVAHAIYGLGSFFWLCVFVFLVILSVLWILVPFAIFGIKGLLRRIARSLETIEKQNVDLLEAWRQPRAVEQVVYRDASGTPVAVREERPLPPP